MKKKGLRRRMILHQQNKKRRQCITVFLLSFIKLSMVMLILSGFVFYMVSLPESSSFFTSKASSNYLNINLEDLEVTKEIIKENDPNEPEEKLIPVEENSWDNPDEKLEIDIDTDEEQDEDLLEEELEFNEPAGEGSIYEYYVNWEQ